VTASGSGAPDRESSTDDAPRRGIGPQIAAVLVVGLIFRLILAYGIDGLRGAGFQADLGLFNYWASVLVEHGPPGFYANASYADYTPGYMYVLWLVGMAREVATSVGLSPDIVDSLIKLPAILADVALAWLVASMALELGVSRRRALVVAAVVVFNPVTWFDSAIWGQVDSFGVVFLLLGLRELWRGRHERAAILAVVAGLIKPQLLILVPIVAVVTIRRALWPAGGYGDEGEPAPRGFAWEFRSLGWRRIVTTGLAGYLTALAIATPFGLSVLWPSAAAPFVDSSLIRLIFSTAATYPYLTVNAFNWWALFPVNGESVASKAFILWIPDSPVPDGSAFGAIGPVPAALIGAALLLGTAALVAWVVARRPDRLTLLVGLTVLAIAFFAVPTRVHERYLFPFFGLGAVLFAVSWRWQVAYLVASAATFLNMYVILVAYQYGTPQVTDWLGIAGLVTTTPGITLIAVTHSLLFVWSLVQLRLGAHRRLALELNDAREAAEEAPGSGSARLPRPAVAASAAPAGGMGAPPPRAAIDGGGSRLAPGARPVPLVPAWYERPAWTRLGPLGWLAARTSETPIRPDRSRLLVGERRGRLDRLDLLVLLVLVVGSLLLRTYRLEDPARMHFDEVYHARTAAEFLQDWRYGIPHDIYEWTHPHLAKYAMAAGIVAFAGHDVQATSDLGVPVRDALVEPRREDVTGLGDRAGDRVWAVTGSELVAWDLETRALVARWSVPGASAIAFDDTSDTILVGTDAGDVLGLDTTALDLDRSADPSAPAADPLPVTTLDQGITRLAAFSGGAVAEALAADGTVTAFGIDAGEVLGSTSVRGAATLAPVDDVQALTAAPALIDDAEGEAARLVELIGGDQAAWVEALTSQDSESVRLDAALTVEERADLKAAMDAGELPGIEFQPTPTMVVAGADGLTFVDAQARAFAALDLPGGVAGVAQVSGIDDGSQVYATTTAADGTPQVTVVAITGDSAATGPEVSSSFALPGAGSTVVFDDAAELVEVLGEAQDGSGPTVYVIEPHGKSVFADHRLPFLPVALALDHNKLWPSTSHGELLAFAGGGETASMDVGSYPFAWRLPGVILGALTVAVLYLLGRMLFRRRAVAALVGLFVVLDGMFFVQSRIAMNDVYTGFFILAAYLLFAWLWLEPERVKRAFWIVAPLMGVLLGLALASKWVAAYAIGALGILVLMRTALGRVLLVAGMLGITALLGWMALAVPAETGGAGNLPFVLIMIGLTLATVVITVYRPVAWSADEVRFAVGAPAVLGILVALTSIAMGTGSDTLAIGPAQFTAIEAGFALVVVGLLAYLAFVVGGRLGVGPLARPSPDGRPGGPPPAAPAPEGWVRLGWGLGIPTLWLGVSLLVIPLAVYVVSYLPWAFDGTSHRILESWPPGHTGDTLLQLTGRMYDYHNGLTAAHAASSPWWAWPLNLKPVWFYQGSYAEGTAAAIYDAGNMVIWWMGIPAMLFVAYQAFRRRSLALALILVAFLAQWISWARIDRAAFQYHYYTSLPFVVLALGYFAAEIWHGSSRRIWLLARVSAAVAVMGPVILWLLRYPLCAIADVESVNAGSQACNGTAGGLTVSLPVVAAIVVAVVTAVVLVWQLMSLGRPRADGSSAGVRDLVPLALTAAVGGATLAITRLLPEGEPLFTLGGMVPELLALLAAIPLGLLAIQVLTARDARRFVGGLVAAAAVWFVVLYPNIAALPMPSSVVSAYQVLLPTYPYPFQFGVNTTPRPETTFADPKFLVLVAFLVVACAVVAYAAWAWRQALAEPVDAPDDAPVDAPDGGDGGTAGEAGATP
jgi:hypothetical protein